MTQTTQAKIITIEELRAVPVQLPKSWTNVIGILKGKRINPLQYQRRIRKGWARRNEKLYRTIAHGN